MIIDRFTETSLNFTAYFFGYFFMGLILLLLCVLYSYLSQNSLNKHEDPLMLENGKLIHFYI